MEPPPILIVVLAAIVIPEVCVSAPLVRFMAPLTVTALFQVNVPPGVEKVRLFN